MLLVTVRERQTASAIIELVVVSVIIEMHSAPLEQITYVPLDMIQCVGQELLVLVMQGKASVTV